jgi:pimeloyl-ACP methyl ester carboxylesterase
MLRPTPFHFFLLALASFLPLAAQQPTDPAGHWEGQINLPATQLGIRVDLERAGDAWSGTIDIPGQGLRGFKLEPVTVDGVAVRFVLPKIPGDPTFSGQFDKDGGSISGDFTQAGIKAPFKLERRARPAAVAGEMPLKGLPGEGLVGHWQGSLKPSPVVELRLALEITKTPAGTYTGQVFSLDQTKTGIPISALTETSGSIAMKVASIGGSYEGKLSADGSEFIGEWQQAGQKFPLTFKRVAKAPSLNRPQDPHKPYPYAEEEVQVKTATDGVTLAGTFTIPPGVGPHPAVVLITGSGPQDRDEALMGHRPFLVLADHLARAGLAVLRCDDRGVGKSTGDFSKAVTADFADDALAAVAWLQTRKEIDPRRIGLIGHSEGGIVAPMAAVKKPADIAFIVLLAGVGIPMDELLIQQSRDIGRVMGMSEDHLAENIAAQREMFPQIKQATDDVAAEKVALEIMTRRLGKYPPEERKVMGLTDEMVAAQARMVATPWFRKLLAYDPRQTLREVKCPVLAINGEKDLQVAAKENLAAIREALAAGGNTRVKIAELPGLNHLFQTCTTGALSEYGQIEETFAPTALERISSWIREQTAP